jgi:hypothetical protein
MYIPTTEEIITRGPRFNSFFRAPNNVSKLVSQIANVARQNEGLDSSYTFKTVQAIAMSPWNHHILYDLRGYENYGFEGPQYTKDYSLEPLAAPGTGNNYPVIWIPDPDSPLEPGQLFEPQAIPEPAPGFDEIAWTPPEIQQMAYDPEPLPEEIVSELADPTRQTIVLEPLTQEAQEIALANPKTPEQKAAAVMEISDLALAADLADPTTIEDVRNQALMTIGQQALEEEIVYAQVIETPIDEPSYMDQPYQEKGTGIGPWAFVTGTIAAIKIFGS